MKFLIVLHHRFGLWNAPAWFTERLRQDFPGVDVEHFSDYPEAERHLPEGDAIVTWSLRPEQLAVARKLRWIHSPAAAVHQLMFPQLVNSDIVVTNASAVHAPVVAEHVIALMMALAKNLPSAVRYQQQHVWCQQQLWDEHPHPREVAGAAIGIVGLGSIGGEVARRAIALDMRIVAIREHPEKGIPEPLRPFLSSREMSSVEGTASSPTQAFEVLGPADLERLLSVSDYVVLCAPLRPSTQALINAGNLPRMKRDACLINVGRGALIDEPALIDALRQHRIGGAALDVFEHEPLPAESPLWDLPNVLITPHSAALTDRLWERHYDVISGNLRRFLAGLPLLGVVDKRRGY